MILTCIKFPKNSMHKSNNALRYVSNVLFNRYPHTYTTAYTVSIASTVPFVSQIQKKKIFGKMHVLYSCINLILYSSMINTL